MSTNENKCIDKLTMVDLRLALITARDTFYDKAKELEKTGWVSPEAEVLRSKADQFHVLINKLGKISC